MLQPATINFLKDLANNNNKPWFDANRDAYQAAKADFELFITKILGHLAEQEPLFKEQQAKDCIFRIFRDVRFSKDKTPYKSHFGAFFSKGGKKFPGAGYYLHLDPAGKSFAGGGLWMPENPVLKAVRQEIDYNFDAFSKIVKAPKFKKLFPEVEGEQLKKVPQGYDESNPAIAYLKLKSFTVTHELPAGVWSKSPEAKIMEIFGTMQPFIDFLNHALE
jgi:uncharacterized protein (TIGR02453 family)